MTNTEREEMRRHEAWISQPVSVLFPPVEGVEVHCVVCGTLFIRKRIVGGKARTHCSAKCRDPERRSPRPPRMP